jgi:hypothetical protein
MTDVNKSWFDASSRSLEVDQAPVRQQHMLGMLWIVQNVHRRSVRPSTIQGSATSIGCNGRKASDSATYQYQLWVVPLPRVPQLANVVEIQGLPICIKALFSPDRDCTFCRMIDIMSS